MSNGCCLFFLKMKFTPDGRYCLQSRFSIELIQKRRLKERGTMGSRAVIVQGNHSEQDNYYLKSDVLVCFFPK